MTKILLKRRAGLFLCLCLSFLPCPGNVFCGEKEELDEILRLDSQLIQSIEKNEIKDKSQALNGLVGRYRQFLRKYPRNVEARNYLGGLYYDIGMPDKAFREWSAGLRINPDNPYLHNNISEYYAHTKGEPARAIAEVKKAIALKDDVAVFHFNLANYYDLFRFTALSDFKSLGKVFEECVKEYRKAVELDPANFDFAFVYAATLTYSPKIWGVEDSSSSQEKIAAWERSLVLVSDTARKELIEKILSRLR